MTTVEDSLEYKGGGSAGDFLPQTKGPPRTTFSSQRGGVFKK